MNSYKQFLELYRKVKTDHTCELFPVNKIRDLTIINLFNELSLVIACDSDGAIGSKQNDIVKCSNYKLGRLAARVPLMEIICSGAIPISIVDTLSVEMNPTGKEIIAGILCEASAAGITSKNMITGSTEDNVPTSQTGVGVTIIGLVHIDDFRPGSSKSGDVIISIGLPKSGPEHEISLEDPEIINLTAIRKITMLDYIHDILPVGSKGIAYEASIMAETAKLQLQLETNLAIDINKSAGPSTCVLASLTESYLSEFKNIISHPIHLIGYIY